MDVNMEVSSESIQGFGSGRRPAAEIRSRQGSRFLKVTGEDTGGAFDYFVVEVAPLSGPPLHVHHIQEETIHVLNGQRTKVRIGNEFPYIQEGGFAYLPSKVPHAFLNLTYEPGEYHRGLYPGWWTSNSMRSSVQSRGSGPPDPNVIAPLFAKYDMAPRGLPLSPD